MIFKSRRILASVLLFVTITGLVISFGENVLCAGELPGAHDKTQTVSVHEADAFHESTCPCAPSPSNTPNDHTCVGDCYSPCHAPLPATSITYNASRSFTYLYHSEPAQYIPEVFLSLFVPPDSATV
jgi:hypothetical protein